MFFHFDLTIQFFVSLIACALFTYYVFLLLLGTRWKHVVDVDGDMRARTPPASPTSTAARLARSRQRVAPIVERNVNVHDDADELPFANAAEALQDDGGRKYRIAM